MKYYPFLKKQKKGEIKIIDLLAMRSGLGFKETYEDAPFNSSVVNMLYLKGHYNMANYALSSSPVIHPPDTHFSYSSGDTNILMGLLKIALKNNYKDFAWKQLFNKLGINDITWESDQSGVLVGSSYLYARPRDLARFAQLLLNKGVWGNKRILPQEWIEISTSPHSKEYGLHWWLNSQKKYPALPTDSYMATGYRGQSMTIVPSLKLIIVRTALDNGDYFDQDLFYKFLLKAIGDSK